MEEDPPDGADSDLRLFMYASKEPGAGGAGGGADEMLPPVAKLANELLFMLFPVEEAGAAGV